MSNPTAETPLLEARGIYKSFELGSQEIRVLRGVDLKMYKGEILTILGTSGVGKSTLLHILGTLERPTRGEVFYRGEAIAGWTEDRRAGLRNKAIGFVFQFHHLLPELTAIENVLVPGLIAGSTPAQLMPRAEELLFEVGLSDRLHHRPAELSGGELQRVAVARALFWDPPLVMADEPTGNLDPETGEKLHQLIYTLAKRREQSWLIVTHNENLSRMADRRSRVIGGILVEE
ncbi:MAG: ABC transporter ATP-binding protein [Candidatus Eisenbacteria bacterium]|uniref:ABC transporter ATP-binding protein n=1 Tax=Eiseniibacteriota bacterium TaxID=2212470 RepID=A0A948RTI2_UNCEI|nr:ABC transporter ATP-binding protein [Candidatus Eisenbacteria bacterium]MBU2690276.1 ABC transporter ATP-binding protein [Candidatus Eisenbacteria bacterium]